VRVSAHWKWLPFVGGDARRHLFHERCVVEYRRWRRAFDNDARLCRAHADYDRFDDLVGWHMMHSEYSTPPYRWEKHAAPV
jgi:hypothetical protein